MNSAEWLVAFMIAWAAVSTFFLVVFVAWELTQLARRRAGNKSARTASQWIEKKIEEGSKFWTRFAIWFPVMFGLYGVILVLAALWLLLGHWSGVCVTYGYFCWDI